MFLVQLVRYSCWVLLYMAISENCASESINKMDCRVAEPDGQNRVDNPYPNLQIVFGQISHELINNGDRSIMYVSYVVLAIRRTININSRASQRTQMKLRRLGRGKTRRVRRFTRGGLCSPSLPSISRISNDMSQTAVLVVDGNE